MGLRGTLILVAVVGGVYLFAPDGIKQAIFGLFSGGDPAASNAGRPAGGSVCAASPTLGKACDFSRVVLASTEDVWAASFAKGALPDYGRGAPAYRNPTLVVFSGGVATGGCGNPSSAVGPFYCPGDQKLYIDPSFYDTMARRLRAPGDFAQAYVIAHEVGHHVQHLFGAHGVRVPGEDRNQTSVRLELQADCLAGVWGHTARASLSINDRDCARRSSPRTTSVTTPSATATRRPSPTAAASNGCAGSGAASTPATPAAATPSPGARRAVTSSLDGQGARATYACVLRTTLN